MEQTQNTSNADAPAPRELVERVIALCEHQLSLIDQLMNVQRQVAAYSLTQHLPAPAPPPIPPTPTTSRSANQILDLLRNFQQPSNLVEHFTIHLPLFEQRPAQPDPANALVDAQHIMSTHMTRLHPTEVPQEFQCSVCLGSADEGVVRTDACSHVFHQDCLMRWLRIDGQHRCPLCRGRLCQSGHDADSEDSEDSDSVS